MRVCLQSADEYCEVLRMLFSTCGGGFLYWIGIVLGRLERCSVHSILEFLLSSKFIHFIEEGLLVFGEFLLLHYQFYFDYL